MAEGGDEFPHPELSQEDLTQADKDWTLEHCKMDILDHRKKTNENFMTLVLQFKFDYDPEPKIVEFPYKSDVFKEALMYCNTALQDFLYLDGTENTGKYFKIFLDQEIRKYKTRFIGGSLPSDKRPTRDFSEPSVVKCEDYYLLVASEIYDLRDGSNVTVLTEEDQSKLPEKFYYKGPPTHFQVDEKKAFRCLLSIISRMNSLQDSRFYSFPLATFMAHLSGEMYTLIIEKQKNFVLQVSCSGDATGTGKSLAQSIWMITFHGEEVSTVSSITEAAAYQMLAKGQNIYAKEFVKQGGRKNVIGIKFLQWAITTLWEQSGSVSTVKANRPQAVVHLDANILPSELETPLGGPMMSKLKCIYTGDQPIEDDFEVIEKIIEEAHAFSSFLPVIMAWGVDTVLPVVKPTEISDYTGILKKSGDKREAQIIKNYDRMYSKCQDAAARYDLELPPLFNKPGIDRTAYVYLNSNEEDKETDMEIASDVAEAIEQHRLEGFIEESGRGGTFKIPVAELGRFPAKVAKVLKKIKSTSSTFRGKTGKRVIILQESSMSESTSKKMKLLSSARYELWLKQFEKDEEERMKVYGESLYAAVSEKSLENGSEVGESDEDDEAAPEMEDVVAETEEVLAESFKCLKPGCREEGTAFSNAAELEKHEKLKYHKNAKPKRKKRGLLIG